VMDAEVAKPDRISQSDVAGVAGDDCL
jgi:hypothetical protein